MVADNDFSYGLDTFPGRTGGNIQHFNDGRCLNAHQTFNLAPFPLSYHDQFGGRAFIGHVPSNGEAPEVDFVVQLLGSEYLLSSNSSSLFTRTADQRRQTR